MENDFPNDFDDVREPTVDKNRLNDQDHTVLLDLVSEARGTELGQMMIAGKDIGSPTTRLVFLTALEHKLIVLKVKA